MDHRQLFFFQVTRLLQQKHSPLLKFLLPLLFLSHTSHVLMEFQLLKPLLKLVVYGIETVNECRLFLRYASLCK